MVLDIIFVFGELGLVERKDYDVVQGYRVAGSVGYLESKGVFRLVWDLGWQINGDQLGEVCQIKGQWV